MNKVNYQKRMEEILRGLPEENNGGSASQAGPVTGKKKLLLHSCCAPCSSYVLESLRSHFAITVLYYNPNITRRQEYDMRMAEQKRLIEEMNGEAPSFIALEAGRYEPEVFFAAAKGLEQLPEGGERCFRCYELRLRETARLAGEKGFDYFTTTLTISPLKNADKLNEIGERLAVQYGVPFLPSDFKKKDGYKRSVELSEHYGLYRQDYCGCIFSEKEQHTQPFRQL